MTNLKPKITQISITFSPNPYFYCIFGRFSPFYAQITQKTIPLGKKIIEISLILAGHFPNTLLSI